MIRLPDIPSVVTSLKSGNIPMKGSSDTMDMGDGKLIVEDLTDIDQRVDVLEAEVKQVFPPGTSASSVLIGYLATEKILEFTVITSLGTQGNSNITSQKNKVIGIAIATTEIGFRGQAVGFGEITNSAWAWTVGDKLFLNGTIISTVAPSVGYIQIIGTATTASTIDVKISQSLLL